MSAENKDRLYIEKAHELTTPPDLFAGRIPDILTRRFSWENLKTGDRLELTASDSQSKNPKTFCFELLGRRKPPKGELGEELLIRFIKGSNEFHFYSKNGFTDIIPLGSEGLIGVSADLIENGQYKPSFLMLDGGGVGLGRDLTFEDIRDARGENLVPFCIAEKIAAGHHFVPQEPIVLNPSSEEARFLLRGILAEKRSSYLTREEFVVLKTHPNFNLQVNRDIRGIGVVVCSTSIPDLYFVEYWSGYDRNIIYKLAFGIDEVGDLLEGKGCWGDANRGFPLGEG